MAIVKVGKACSMINEFPQGIEVIIPTKKYFYNILFLTIWLIGWAVGEASAIGTLLNPESQAPTLFMVIWLGGWTVGGVWAAFAWLWNVKGKELVRIDGLELKHTKDFVLFKRSKEYEVAHIKDMRANPGSSSFLGSNGGTEFWGFTVGTVAFDYGHSTHNFGAGLDEAEAKYIVEIIKKRYKNL